MNEIAAAYLGTGARVWIIDVGRSYEKACRNFGGSFIEFTEDAALSLNPFPLVEDIDEDMELLQPLLAQMVSPRESLDGFQYSTLGAAIKKVWKAIVNVVKGLVNLVKAALHGDWKAWATRSVRARRWHARAGRWCRDRSPPPCGRTRSPDRTRRRPPGPHPSRRSPARPPLRCLRCRRLRLPQGARGFLCKSVLALGVVPLSGTPEALGDYLKFEVTLISPIAMEEKQRFAIREGGKTVGAGVVAKIIE